MITYQDESYPYQEQPRGVIQYVIPVHQFDDLDTVMRYEERHDTLVESKHAAQLIADTHRISVEIEVRDYYGMYGSDYLETVTVHPSGNLQQLLQDISNDLKALGI